MFGRNGGKTKRESMARYAGDRELRERLLRATAAGLAARERAARQFDRAATMLRLARDPVLLEPNDLGGTLGATAGEHAFQELANHDGSKRWEELRRRRAGSLAGRRWRWCRRAAAAGAGGMPGLYMGVRRPTSRLLAQADNGPTLLQG